MIELEQHKNEKVVEAASHKTADIHPLNSHLTYHSSKTSWTQQGKQVWNSLATFSDGLLRMDTPVSDDQHS